MDILSELRSPAIALGGLNLLPLFASWARSEGQIDSALLPIGVAQEGAEALAVSGAGFLILANATAGTAVLFSNEPFPPSLARWLRGQVPGGAHVARSGGTVATGMAIMYLSEPGEASALAGGPWEVLAEE